MTSQDRPESAQRARWFRESAGSVWLSIRHGRPRTLSAYVVSVLAVALMTAFRIGLDPVLGEHHPFTLYFAAVAISSWYGGLGAGLLATGLSYFAADWFFIAPRFEINWPRENLD